jgi:hypothetical protein
MSGACSMHGKYKNAYKMLVRKPEGRKPLGKSRNRWEDNIKVDFRETVGKCGLNSSG